MPFVKKFPDYCVRFVPVYWLDAYIRTTTAVVSIITAAALFPVIPRVSRLINAERLLRDHQLQLEQSNAALSASVLQAEFTAALGDALQKVHDPQAVAQLALVHLGPVLQVKEIVATQIRAGRAHLWSSWGDLNPDTLAMLSGEGLPLGTTMMGRAVQTGETQSTEHSAQRPSSLAIADLQVAVTIEPIKNARGQVVGTLNFSRAAGQLWQTNERQLVRRAAATIALALDRTETAQALKVSEAQLNEAMQNAPLGELVVELGGRVSRVNPAASRIFGLSKDQLVGLPLDALFQSQHETDLSQELQDLRSRGEETAEFELRSSASEGSEVWLQVHVSGIRDEDTQVQQFILQVQDVTDKRQAHRQLQTLSRQLERSNRDLQSFAAVSSHDLQEPLRKILAFGERLQSSDGEHLSEAGRLSLERMVNAAGRMQGLIHDLLALSRVSSVDPQLQQIDLNELFDQVVEDLEEQLTRTGGHVTRTSLPVLLADRTQMRQLFQNLIGNGLKYHRKDVPPEVSILALPFIQGGVEICVSNYSAR